MSIKRTGGRKPTMGNWRASIWPRANMQYVNVVISMGICIWMHARYTGASPPGDTRALATCALGLTPVRHPRCATRYILSCSFLRPPFFDFREYRARSDATHQRRADLRMHFSFTPRPNAFSRCLHAVSELIKQINGSIKIKKKNGYLLPEILSPSLLNSNQIIL